MRSFPTAILILVAAVTLAGCSLKAKKPALAATPAPPRPAVGSPPPPVIEPLSIPQTQVRLPPPQPVSEEALASIQEPGVVELPEPPSPKPVRRVGSPPPGPKPESPPVAQGPAAPATPAAEPERPRIQELVAPAEQKQLSDSLEARRREIRYALDQAAARGPSAHEKNLINRINSFLRLSDEALARGDARQADAQAERAQILCRELHGAR
jgi:hypothetical protein